MAMSPKILLIRYADKLAFLLALGILGYAAASSFLLRDKADSGQASELKEIRNLQNSVRELIGKSEPTPEKVPVLTGQLRERWRIVPPAVMLPPFRFQWPSSKKYDPVKLRVGQTKVIETLDPFTSHRFDGDPTVIKVGEIKDRKVTIVAEEKGSVTLKGEDAKGVTHEIPILVLPPKALIVISPAKDFKAVPTLGQVALSWAASQKPPEGVTKLQWAVFRRHEGDPVDQFREAAKVEETEYVDKDIKSGETYFYYVQAVAETEDGVKESKRSDIQKIVATSVVEFALISASGDIALVEVRRFFGDEWLATKFSVRRGGLIGGLQRGVDYSTGCTLVDILTSAPRVVTRIKKVRTVGPAGGVEEKEVEEKRTIRTNKVIYEDKKGHARMAWQERPAARQPRKPEANKAKKVKDKDKPRAADGAGGNKDLIQAVD